MRVVVATMFSPSHQELADLTVPNMESYANKHGYDTHIIKIENDKWEYKKHDAFKELFKTYDLIWYKDVDSIITNMTIPITDYIDGTQSFFITKDWTELNGGSICLLNNEWGVWINNMVLANRFKYQNEQNVYNANYDMMVIGNSIKVLPQHTINAYLYELYPEIGKLTKEQGQWEEGCLLLHTPALQMKDRIETLKNAKITI